jgi:hypothetical protein
MLRVVVEAVCILPCYSARRMQPNKTRSLHTLMVLGPSPNEQPALDNQCDVTPTVLATADRVYSDRNAHAALEPISGQLARWAAFAEMKS